MNKTEMIAAIAEKSGLSKADAARALDATVETVTQAMAAGDTVSLIGFGTFKVSERAARQGRNPKTGDTITIAAAKLPKFTPGKALKDAVK